jgi:hypothetical protein
MGNARTGPNSMGWFMGSVISCKSDSDTVTAIGAWRPELFIKIIRTGKFMGIESGRSLLPPMPWENYRQMSDEAPKQYLFI